MAPLWAQAKAAAPTPKNKRAALAANAVPSVLRNRRDIFKISASRKLHPYILLNPEASEKLYGMVRGIAGRHRGCLTIHPPEGVRIEPHSASDEARSSKRRHETKPAVSPG